MPALTPAVSPLQLLNLWPSLKVSVSLLVCSSLPHLSDGLLALDTDLSCNLLLGFVLLDTRLVMCWMRASLWKGWSHQYKYVSEERKCSCCCRYQPLLTALWTASALFLAGSQVVQWGGRTPEGGPHLPSGPLSESGACPSTTESGTPCLLPAPWNLPLPRQSASSDLWRV